MNHLKRKIIRYLLITLVALTCAFPAVKTDAASSTRFTKSTYKVGKGYKVTLKVKNTGGQKITWKIGKKAKKRIKVVGTSSNSITVRGKKTGRTQVTAMVGTKKVKTTVRIKKRYIYLSKKSMTLKKGKSAKIFIDGAKKVTWSSSNKKVATVTKVGKTKAKIRAKKAGTAYIRAKVGGKVYKCRIRVKGKKNNSPLVKIPNKKNAKWKSLHRKINKNTIKVKIKTSLTDKANAAKVRKIWNLSESTPLYDTVTISLTNNTNKDIAVRHDYYFFGTLFCNNPHNRHFKISDDYASWEDPKENVGRIAIKARKTRTQTYKIKDIDLTCYHSYNSSYGFYSPKVNEPVQVLLDGLGDSPQANIYLYLYFPATGKTAILDGKNYTRKYNSYSFTSYLDFRKYKGDYDENNVEVKYAD